MARATNREDDRKAAAQRAARHRIDRVNEWLQLGGAPAIEDYLRLVERGITHVIDLRQDGELNADPGALESLGIAWRRLPVANHGVPEDSALAGTLAWLETASSPRQVYVHCVGGIGRGATIAAALLIFQGKPAAAAFDEVRRARPEVEISQAQATWLRFLEVARRRSMP